MTAYCRGQFIEENELALAINDPAFVLGTAISERLRTFGGKAFRVQDHLQRLEHSLGIVDLATRENLAEIDDIIRRIVDDRYAEPHDVAVVLLALPASNSVSEKTAELIIYALPLDYASYADLYQHGQAIQVSSYRQPPPVCWPSELKCRSRMHYFLADREAARKEPGARALLLDPDGNVTECSTANILGYHGSSGFVSPLREKILPGISVAVVEQFAKTWGIPFTYRDLRPEELESFDQIVLCSTTPCAWACSSINGQQLPLRGAGTIIERIHEEWSALVKLDFCAQAIEGADRQ